MIAIYLATKQVCNNLLSQVTMKALQILAVLVTLLTLCHAIQTEYFVRPNDSTPCPGLPCHTFSHYLESATQYFASNTRVSFLPGVHEIDKLSFLWIKNVSNFIFTGYNVSSMHAAKIVCRRPAILAFFNIVNLVIKHLSIVYCGFPSGYKRSVAVYLVDITSLKVSNVSVENSTGYGIIGINVLGNSSVSHSRFIFNNYYTLTSTNCSNGLGSCQGGNMLLFYPKSVVNITGSNSVLSIDSCVFSDGVDVSNGPLHQISGGLTINYNPNQLLNLDILISNVVSTRNVAKLGANILFFFSGIMIGSINITNITSSMANYLLPPSQVLFRTGFEFHYYKMDGSIQIPFTNQTLLHISDTKFYNNNGVGFSFVLSEAYNNVRYHMIIKNCSFLRNVNPIASGLFLGEFQRYFTSKLEVLVQDTSFTNHMLPEQNVQTSTRFNVVAVHNLKHLKIINCTFAMNKITALQAFDSTLYFGGHVIFSGNNGRLGGALILQGGSQFYLMPHTHVQIFNNHARRGGGIYVEGEAIVTSTPCFFQLVDLHYPYSDINSVVTLENNTADEAGSAVSGGEIDSCQLYSSSKQTIRNGTVNAVFAALFKILDLPSLNCVTSIIKSFVSPCVQPQESCHI